jgi:uncharacterized membrane protein YfcA
VELALLFLLGLVASFLSNIAGGGGEMLLLPTLLALGIDPLQAIGSGKLGAIGMMIGSNVSSRRKGFIRKDHLKPLLVVVGISSVLGPLLAFNIAEDTVKVVTSILVVIAAIVAIASWKVAGRARQMMKWHHRLGYGLYFLTTTFLSGFGSGIGILNTYVMITLLGMSPLEAISTRRFLGLIWLPIQVLPFIITGNFNIGASIALFFGSLIGSYLGLNTAIKKGNQFVKRAMAVVAIVLVVSLFV